MGATMFSSSSWLVCGSVGSMHFRVTKPNCKLCSWFYWSGCSPYMELCSLVWCLHCPKRDYYNAHIPPFATVSDRGAPMKQIWVDIPGSFPTTYQENYCVIVTMDYFTKCPEVCISQPERCHYKWASGQWDVLLYLFGVHKELHNNQEWNFEAAVFNVVCQHLGILRWIHHCTPQSDRLVECFNQNQIVIPPSWHELTRQTLFWYSFTTGTASKDWGEERLSDIVYRVLMVKWNRVVFFLTVCSYIHSYMHILKQILVRTKPKRYMPRVN